VVRPVCQWIPARTRASRGADGKESATDRNGVTLSGLLKVLDGFYAPTNVLFMMSTNRIEMLDDALLRPGRIDVVLPNLV
jgi:mitochondrial chaperone BCS1